MNEKETKNKTITITPFILNTPQYTIKIKFVFPK